MGWIYALRQKAVNLAALPTGKFVDRHAEQGRNDLEFGKRGQRQVYHEPSTRSEVIRRATSSARRGATWRSADASSAVTRTVVRPVTVELIKTRPVARSLAVNFTIREMS